MTHTNTAFSTEVAKQEAVVFFSNNVRFGEIEYKLVELQFKMAAHGTLIVTTSVCISPLLKYRVLTLISMQDTVSSYFSPSRISFVNLRLTRVLTNTSLK